VFVALGIQHAMRMHHIVICGLTRSTIFFHIISQTAGFLETKLWENQKCALIFLCNFLCQIFPIMRRTERDMTKNVYSVKFPSFLSDFNNNLIFSAGFQKTLKYKIPCKSVQREPSCSMRTGGRICRF